MAYTSTTRAALRLRCRERLIATFWSDTEINLYINEALRVWNVLTSYFQAQTPNTIIVGSIDGQAVTTDIAADCIAPLRFIDQFATKRAWAPTALDEISALQLDWLNVSFTVPDRWIPVGLDRFYLYPLTNFFSSTIRIDYVMKAPVPAGDGDYIQVGEEDMSAIVDYVTFIGHLKEGGVEFQGSIPLFQNFLRQVAKYNSKISQSLVFNKLLGMPAGGQSDKRPDSLDSQSRRG